MARLPAPTSGLRVEPSPAVSIQPREPEENLRSRLARDMVDEWTRRLARPTAGHTVIAAVLPVMGEWLERRFGSLSFRLTQVLTGHGCFGRYLCRIGREPTPRCHHCEGCPDDSARHTLEECPAWAEPRRTLVRAAGLGRLTLLALVLSMVGGAGPWEAAVTFCEEVMSAKETAERERERTRNRSLPPRRGGAGRRRRDDLRPP